MPIVHKSVCVPAATLSRALEPLLEAQTWRIGSSLVAPHRKSKTQWSTRQNNLLRAPSGHAGGASRQAAAALVLVLLGALGSVALLLRALLHCARRARGRARLPHSQRDGATPVGLRCLAVPVGQRRLAAQGALGDASARAPSRSDAGCPATPLPARATHFSCSSSSRPHAPSPSVKRHRTAGSAHLGRPATRPGRGSRGCTISHTQ